jgi:thiamine biosynthesis lipoprotein
MTKSMYKTNKQKSVSSIIKCCLAPALSIALIGGFLPSTVYAAADDSVSNTGFYLDTVIAITAYGTTNESVIDDCFSLISDYESLLSRTMEGSDIWNVNHSDGEPVTVSEETADLINLALKYSELSDDAFDISLAPYSILWDFQNNTGVVPSDEEIAEAGSHTGLDNLTIDGTTVTLSDPEAAIDLGGIAKGYIADRVKDLLLSEGIESALINLGGNVLTVGSKVDGSNWKIGIRKPFSDASDLSAVVSVNDQSVVTSGTYERYFEVDGVIYHHILDPQTGYPIQNGLDSVTILSDSSADGDALSTTCFVLGLEDGMELIESLDDIEAMFITDDGELHYSSGFPQS